MADSKQQIPVTPQHIRLPRDSTSGALLTIDNSVHKILEGAAFGAYAANLVTSPNSQTLLLTTPNTSKRIYLSFKINTTALVQYFLYENPTISAAGTDIAIYNKDRNSASAATMTVKHTPTVTSVGTTLLTTEYISGIIESGLWILKQNEEYLLMATIVSAANAYITTLVDWIEV